MIGLIIASSHPILLEGLEHAFTGEPGLRVLALSQTGDQVVRAVIRHRPDVVLLDTDIDDHPLAVMTAVGSAHSETRVVLLVSQLDDDLLLEATQLGAKGIVLKQMGRQLLMQCVRKVHQGATWLERASAGRIVERLLRHDESYRYASALLSPRELEIAGMVVAGLSNKEIASRLSISDGTVKGHLHNVYGKLNVKGRLELALYARDRQLFLNRAQPTARRALNDPR